jgi:hypothetical protein
MDNFLSLYHGGNVEEDPYGNAKFIDMRHVPVLFVGRPSLSDVFTKAKQKLGYHEDDDIAVDGVLNIGHPPNVIRQVIPIDSQLDWENYVTSTMKTQLQLMEVVVRRVVVGLPPEDYDRAMDHVPIVPDAQSGPKLIPLSQPGDDLQTDSPVCIPLAHTNCSKFHWHQQWRWFTGASMLRSILLLPLSQQECWSSNFSTTATADNNNGRILWRSVHIIWNVGALLENSYVSISLSVLIFIINCFKSSLSIAFKVQFESIIVHQLLF